VKLEYASKRSGRSTTYWAPAPDGPAWKIGGYERRDDALLASSTPHAGVQPVQRTFPAGDWRSARDWILDRYATWRAGGFDSG